MKNIVFWLVTGVISCSWIFWSFLEIHVDLTSIFVVVPMTIFGILGMISFFEKLEKNMEDGKDF